MLARLARHHAAPAAATRRPQGRAQTARAFGPPAGFRDYDTTGARADAHQRARILRDAGTRIFGGHPATAPAKDSLLRAAALQEDIGNGVFPS